MNLINKINTSNTLIKEEIESGIILKYGKVNVAKFYKQNNQYVIEFYENICKVSDSNYKRIIVNFEKTCLLVNVEYDACTLKMTNNTLFISSEEGLINIFYFSSKEDLIEFSAKNFNYYLPPLFSFKIGIIDNLDLHNKIKYAELTSYGLRDIFYINKDSADLEKNLSKLNINDIDSGIIFNDSFSDREDSYDKYLYNKSGDAIVDKNHNKIINILSEGGKKVLSGKVNSFKDKGIKIALLDDLKLDERFNNGIVYKKSGQLLPYNNLFHIEKSFDEFFKSEKSDTFVFFTFNRFNYVENAIMIESVNKSTDIFYLEELFCKGVRNFALFFSSRNSRAIKEFNKQIPLMLFVPNILFDSKFYLKINKIMSSKLSYIVNLKYRLRIYIENIMLNNFFFEVKFLNKKACGVYFGKDIFFSFVVNAFVKRFYFLPEGTFFDLNSSKVVPGERMYFTDDKVGVIPFVAENSIIPLVDKKLFNDYFKPEKITFLVFVKLPLKKVLIEREIEHLIDVDIDSEVIKINYTSTSKKNIDREICFKVVTEKTVKDFVCKNTKNKINFSLSTV